MRSLGAAVPPYPGMSGAITRNPAVTSGAIWRRQLYPSPGKPWQSRIAGPEPSSMRFQSNPATRSCRLRTKLELLQVLGTPHGTHRLDLAVVVEHHDVDRGDLE